MIALIDADVLCYQVGHGTDDLDKAKIKLDNRLAEIAAHVNATDTELFLSCSRESNFRTALHPDYKAGRQAKPPLLPSLRQYLIDEYEAKVHNGLEADDLLGIYQTKLGDSSIICSIDKDLYQISGNHLNIGGHFNDWTFEEFYIQPEDADWFFCYQWLRGDFVDMVPGIPKVGDKKAKKILEGCQTKEEMYARVIHSYLNDYKLSEEYMLIQANLVYILRDFYAFFSLEKE